jgi:uncharacterized protein YciI
MIGWDGDDGAERRDAWRQQHVDHIRRLESEGRIKFAGPIKENDGTRSIGAVIVLQAADLHEARNVVNTDPFVAGGVFETLTVNPFKQVVPQP